MSLQHIQKNFPGLLHTLAKYEKNLPYGCEAYCEKKMWIWQIRRSRFSHMQQASLVGCLIILYIVVKYVYGMYKLRFCTSCKLVQIACTSSACTSCNPYKISCTSCNLHRISLSNNLTLYNIAVQVGFKGTSVKLNKLTILLKIFLILSV